MKQINSIKVNNLLAIITLITFLIVVSLYSWNILLNEDSINLSRSMYFFCWVGLFSYIFSMFLWKKFTGVLFCPYTMFFTSFVIFQFGQAILYAFGLKYKQYNLFEIYSQKDLLETIIFTVLSFLMFSLGANLELTFKTKNEKKINNDDKYRVTISSMKMVGIVLFVISAPVAFYVTSSQAIISFLYGYGQLYNKADGTNPFISAIEPLFLPSVYMLIISHISNKKVCRFLTLVLLIYAVISLLTGSRTNFMMIVLSLFWLWNTIIKKFNWKSVLKLLILSFILMIIISLIADIRNTGSKSVNAVIGGFSDVLNNNPIVGTIGELGGSMGDFIMVKHIIPAMLPFRLGDSYFYAVFSLFPNLFHIMGPLHPSRTHAMLDAWLQEYLGLSYGPGFSMVSESYYNFGWVGIFVFILWGYIFSKLLGYRKTDNLILNPLRLFVILAIISTCFTLPRLYTLFFIRSFFYYTFLPYILIILVRNNKLQKKDYN